MKITNEVRLDIRRKVLASKFKAREAALQNAITEFADAVYEHAYGTIAARVLELPVEWRHMTDSIYFTAPGWTTKYRVSLDDGPSGRAALSRERPEPKVRSELAITKDHPLFARSQAIVKEHHAIRDEREALSDKVNALLRSVNTDKQLRAAWPEGEQFFPREVQHSTALVPITLTHDINRMLGLEPTPTATKKAIAKAMGR